METRASFLECGCPLPLSVLNFVDRHFRSRRQPGATELPVVAGRLPAEASVPNASRTSALACSEGREGVPPKGASSSQSVPSGLLNSWHPCPTVETVGYFRVSLRDRVSKWRA